MQTGKRSCRGYSYVLLLAAVALLGLAASASISLGATIARRDAEKHLIHVGLEFQRALRSYAGLPVAGGMRTDSLHGPKTLEELVKDNRAAGVRRHLRQIYADPLTGSTEWGLVKDRNGFIVGVHSLARGRPIQQEGFDSSLVGFAGADRYSKWVFGFPHAHEAPPNTRPAP